MFSEGDEVQWECDEGSWIKGVVVQRLMYEDIAFYRIQIEEPEDIRWVEESNLVKI
jgi:hypothetical protein